MVSVIFRSHLVQGLIKFELIVFSWTHDSHPLCYRFPTWGFRIFGTREFELRSFPADIESLSISMLPLDLSCFWLPWFHIPEPTFLRGRRLYISKGRGTLGLHECIRTFDCPVSHRYRRTLSLNLTDVSLATCDRWLTNCLCHSP